MGVSESEISEISVEKEEEGEGKRKRMKDLFSSPLLSSLLIKIKIKVDR